MTVKMFRRNDTVTAPEAPDLEARVRTYIDEVENPAPDFSYRHILMTQMAEQVEVEPDHELAPLVRAFLTARETDDRANSRVCRDRLARAVGMSGQPLWT